MSTLRNLLGVTVVCTLIGATVSYAGEGEKLLRAAGEGDLSQVNTLLAHGADVNAADTAGGSTALMVASMMGHSEVVATLLAHGADVTAEDNTGKTALMLASMEGHNEVARLLKKAGATE